MDHFHRLNKSISRRVFIDKGSKVLATAAFANVLTGCPGLKESPRQKLGIAFIGLGYYSTEILGPALEACQNVSLAGVIAGDMDDESYWISRYHLKRENVYNYENFDEIAENEDIDIVYVVLPNFMHKEYTIRAARAGKHVICEKPMANNAAECRDMIRACKEAGVRLSIGYRLHFEPHTQEVMRLGQEKVFGPLKMINCGAGYKHTAFDHWKMKRALGGGAMMDMGVYPLQAARYVTGEEPISVSAQTFKTRPEAFKDCDEVTTFQLQFPSGAVANLETGFHVGFDYLKVRAENGFFELEPFSTYSGIQGRSSKGAIQFPEINQQAAQMDEVAECIREGKPMRVPGEEGLKDMMVVDAVYQSIEKGGKTISLI